MIYESSYWNYELFYMNIKAYGNKIIELNEIKLIRVKISIYICYLSSWWLKLQSIGC